MRAIRRPTGTRCGAAARATRPWRGGGASARRRRSAGLPAAGRGAGSAGAGDLLRARAPRAASAGRAAPGAGRRSGRTLAPWAWSAPGRRPAGGAARPGAAARRGLGPRCGAPGPRERLGHGRRSLRCPRGRGSLARASGEPEPWRRARVPCLRRRAPGPPSRLRGLGRGRRETVGAGGFRRNDGGSGGLGGCGGRGFAAGGGAITGAGVALRALAARSSTSWGGTRSGSSSRGSIGHRGRARSGGGPAQLSPRWRSGAALRRRRPAETPPARLGTGAATRPAARVSRLPPPGSGVGFAGLALGTTVLAATGAGVASASPALRRSSRARSLPRRRGRRRLPPSVRRPRLTPLLQPERR